MLLCSVILRLIFRKVDAGKWFLTIYHCFFKYEHWSWISLFLRRKCFFCFFFEIFCQEERHCLTAFAVGSVLFFWSGSIWRYAPWFAAIRNASGEFFEHEAAAARYDSSLNYAAFQLLRVHSHRLRTFLLGWNKPACVK